MTEQTNESYLSLRIPTNEKDEKFISGINSSYEAAKLRSASRAVSYTHLTLPTNA